MYRIVSRPIKSASSKGPIGKLAPSLRALSISTGVDLDLFISRRIKKGERRGKEMSQ